MQTAKQRRRSNQLISDINFVSFFWHLGGFALPSYKSLQDYLGNDRVDRSALPIKIQDLVKRGSPQVVYFWVDARARYLYASNVLDADA
jgi:hypothetical protein